MMQISDVFYDIAKDLKITKSIHENEKEFYARIVYSAISVHIRKCILDREFGDIEFGKSKIYIKKKCESILNSFIQIYPDIEEWFFENEENPIKIIRDRLQDAGDIINIGFDNRVDLVLNEYCSISNDFCVLRGLDFENMNNISGITFLKRYISNEEYKSSIDKFYNYNIERRKKRFEYYKSNMTLAHELENTEIFDKYAKCSLYKSWRNDLIIADNDVTIYRNNINDYGFVKKVDGEIYIKPIDKYDIEHKEIRRYMLLLRSECKNQMNVYIDKNDCKYVHVAFKCKLPKDESIILNALGWPINNINGIQFLFKKEVWSYIELILKDLELRVVENKWRNTV